MIQSIKHLYQSPDLDGYAFIMPLQNYQKWIVKRIQNATTPLQKLSTYVSNFIMGIFLYPLCGTLAAIGMAINVFGIYELSYHNMIRRDLFDTIFYGFLALKSNEYLTFSPLEEVVELSTFSDENDEIIRKDVLVKLKSPFIITPTNYATEIKKIQTLIDTETKKYRKIYLSYNKIEFSKTEGRIEICFKQFQGLTL